MTTPLQTATYAIDERGSSYDVIAVGDGMPGARWRRPRHGSTRARIIRKATIDQNLLDTADAKSAVF